MSRTRPLPKRGAIEIKFDIQLYNLVKYVPFLKMAQTYAIVETGGKQYKVAPGQKVEVDRLAVAEGEAVELSRVLLIADGEDTIIGSPNIDGAKVIATCLGEHKGDKIIVFKYKPKVRYRRKKGHRQLYATLEIKEIVKPGEEAAPKKTQKKKAAVGGKS
jgi:large subunit ribosomal protein L21